MSGKGARSLGILQLELMVREGEDWGDQRLMNCRILTLESAWSGYSQGDVSDGT
jgi:hypothetical protein